MLKKLLPWLMLCTLAAFGPASVMSGQTPAARPPGIIKVAKVVGTVTAVKDGATVNLQTGAEISQGYVVNTAKDASVVLVFSNGATLNLAQDSTLSIDEFLQDPFSSQVSVSSLTAEPSTSTTKLNLSRGELVGNVKKLNHDAGSTFEIQTPVGAAGIRGTTFRIVFRPDGTGKAFFSLTTVEGNVVLASGTVNMPSEVSVPDNKEVEVVLDVQVDEATGTITVSAPSTTPVTVIDTPATTQAQVAAVANQVAQAAATVVFTSSTSATTTTTPTGDANSNGQNNSGSNENSGSPPPTQGTPRTTSGDGKSG
jgi:hypothetical protein